MKTRRLLVLLSLLCLPSLALCGPRDAAWLQVENATRAGLPRTAIERLEPIITGAIADKAYPEAIKAIARKIALTSEIEGDAPEVRIDAMQTAITEAPAAMHPVMEAILAHWYWQYFKQNRWRFLQRTATATSPGPDIQTWDLARILEEIDRHFTAALADPTAPQAIPLTSYADLLEPGTVPEHYRPTLFDFLVHEALSFYQTGEQGAREPTDGLVPQADGPIFASTEEFLAWELTEAERVSSIGRAVQLYQQLLRFHSGDADRSAFLDADLARLAFGSNVAVGDDSSARYQAALERFITQAGEHEIAAQAMAVLAAQLEGEDEPARAREIALRAIDRFPGSHGAARCRNLIQRIEAPSAQLATEFVWNAPWPTLDVTYRNVTHVYFRAVPLRFADQLQRGRWQYGQINNELLDAALARTPALAWDAPLPPTEDYRLRTEALPAPAKLPAGLYLVIASHTPNFDHGDNQVSAATVWVSTLALITRQGVGGKTDGGFVLDALSGNPIRDAQVRLWRQTQNGLFERGATARTDENGWYQVTADPRSSYVIEVEHAGQQLATQHPLWNQGHTEREDSVERTVFFTDRALYRPGQSIHYKGIAVRAKRNEADYTTLSRRRVTVVLRDPNGQDVARAEHRTNGYGSFSGVFTAPRDTLLGQMSLIVTDGPDGLATVRVEEYKRPKFQVEIDAPAEAAKLGETVVVNGRARAYSGASVDGAQVQWRVERQVDLPPWCWWLPRVPTKDIAHGTAVTDSDGAFEVSFPAEPDPTVSEKNEPVFRFVVIADVTDTTGETRSHRRVIRAGYRALRASVSADDWQTPGAPVEFNIITASLDGDPQPASGRLVVHALQQPDRVHRPALAISGFWPRPRVSTEEPPPDPTRIDSWALGEVIATEGFTSDAAGVAQVALTLPAGAYRAVVETKDRFGRPVTARHTFQVADPDATSFPVKIAQRVTAEKWIVDPGTTFTALWGTGYDRGRAFIELESAGRILQRYWTPENQTQARITLPVEEAHRGGITLRITFVRENRAHLFQSNIDVPWSDRKLSVSWETFRSKLEPGARETWTAVVNGPDAAPAAAEMAAVLYDASLDQFLAHGWPARFDVFRHEFGGASSQFRNEPVHFNQLRHWRRPSIEIARWIYPAFPMEIIAPSGGREILLSAFSVGSRSEGFQASTTIAGTRLRTDLKDIASSIDAAGANFMQDAASLDLAPGPLSPGAGDVPQVNLDQVRARQNLDETAFFFPHLLSEKDGTVRMSFTMPEALTQWRFFGFAHDKRLRSGFLTDTAVTAKDLMVQPNPPRFLREGDVVEFTVKVSNQGETPLSGKVRLTLLDAETQESVDAALDNAANEQEFAVPAKQSRTYSWRLRIPDGLGVLTYRAVAATTGLSDGEEGFLPVLSRRILVTESLPLPIRDRGRREFRFDKLLESAGSDTLRHQSLTVQMTSQPAWYAVLALPYLMEFPYECSEQVFSRYYANALAAHIADSDPKIRRVFDLWKASTDVPVSPLEQNEEIKAVLLEETPWVRQAKSETEARRRIGLLFDANRLEDEAARALRTLDERQSSDGMWAWFPGGRPSEYISLYIATGFGRMRQLGVATDVEPAVKALAGLDKWIVRRHEQIQERDKPDEYVPDALVSLYLYGRSFFLQDRELAPATRTAVDFFLAQGRKLWVDVSSRQSQAHLALALHRFGDATTAQAIVRSLKERSVTDDELGRFWRESAQSWWWYRAPIETHALMIEALDEVAQDTAAVEECKVWLLKQKQTQAWPSTKATADAVYSLLLRGSNILASDARVEVALAGETVNPPKVEAGTGFYQQRFTATEIRPEMGEITVTKPDTGVSWGSVHWQYLEDIAKITAHAETPLQLKKTLYVKKNTDSGPVLQPVDGPIAVGDELVVRLELRADRDMEFVHLKDQRGSGTEPVDVLSGYRYQDGLGYTMSTRDTATHIFIDHLPRGTYVFEYSTRVQLRGNYQSGIAEIQCMYAPEYNSHSESIAIEVTD